MCAIKWGELGPVALVPIPDSACTWSSPITPRTLKLAAALTARIVNGDSIAADGLRWNEPMPAANAAGGTRDPQQLFVRLRLRGTLPVDRRVVLVDDVLTTGGHLSAAAAFLESHGRTIGFAVCAGRSHDGVTVQDAFTVKTDILESINRPAL